VKPGLISVIIFCAIFAFGCITLGQDEQVAGTNQSNTTTNQTNDSANMSANDSQPPVQKNTTTVLPVINKSVNETPSQPQFGMKYNITSNQYLDIYFIDVGQLVPETKQGEAILLKRGDLEILVNGGPNGSSDRLLSFLKSKNVDDIDLLISTSSDPKNSEVFSNISKEFTIEEFWYSGQDNGNVQYGERVQKIKDKGVYYGVVGSGYNITANDIRLTVLNPQDKSFGNPHDDSLVIRIDFGRNFSMLLTSSIHEKAQQELLKKNKKMLNCSIMQAPYYGLLSATENISAFLDVAVPQTVIITGTVDDSKKEGGSRLKFKEQLVERGIAYFETYNGGTVIVRTDGFETWLSQTGTPAVNSADTE
jgi:competence protein ComEC